MIGEMFGIMFLIGIVGVVLAAVAPYFLFLFPAAVLVWALVAVCQEADKRADEKLMRKISLIKRADNQHSNIMSGDIERGTYGSYPPAV